MVVEELLVRIQLLFEVRCLQIVIERIPIRAELLRLRVLHLEIVVVESAFNNIVLVREQ